MSFREESMVKCTHVTSRDVSFFRVRARHLTILLRKKKVTTLVMIIALRLLVTRKLITTVVIVAASKFYRSFVYSTRPRKRRPTVSRTRLTTTMRKHETDCR